MWVMWERVCWITRFSRLEEPRPRPTYWVVCSTCFSQVTLSNPSTRCSVSTRSIASTSVASLVICRFPRPLGGVRAVSCTSAWCRRFSKPAACWAACMGERTTNTRSRHPQGVQRSHHHFDLGSRRIIFTLAKLHEAPFGDLVITRHCGGITTDDVLRQGVHLNAACIQVAFDLVPIGWLAQVF